MSVVSIRRFPPLHVVTTHGRVVVEPRSGDETIIELLTRIGIPWSGISAFSFGENRSGQIIAKLQTTFAELRDEEMVVVYFSRNINSALFDILDHDIAPAQDGDEVTSFIYQKIDNDNGRVNTVLKGLSQSESQSIIKSRVADFCREYCRPGGELVVGISGGGDSNALLLGLTSFSEFELNVRPVILRGVADWDAGVPRAQELCTNYGLELTVVDDAEVRRICSLKGDEGLIELYEQSFPGDDFEFLGTYMIRRVLSSLASQTGATVLTGLNFEDVLAESLYRVMTGKRPLSFPIRNIGGTDFGYPLWRCPKKIIDGCFPKYSLENYEMRYPCFSVGRSLYYMMAYMLQSQFPGPVEQLLTGLQALSGDDDDFVVDPDFGAIINGPMSAAIRERFRTLVSSC
jgi:hypothetical protein